MEAAEATRTRTPRLSAVLREEEQVKPLELFFDLVFVLAITQCTNLMAENPSWEGIGQAVLVLGVLWWAWVGYAWLTSVVDPEEGAVRIAIFAAMAALLVVAICVPQAFGSLGFEFALGYGAVRAGHIALFVLASRDDPGLRHSVAGLAISTAIGVGLLMLASDLDGPAQAGVWSLALALDMGGPLVIDPGGWRLIPAHFAERHGLIIIVALGEAIVAIGIGAEATLTAGIVAAAVLGIGIATAQWWTYFDVVAIVSARRLLRAPEGIVRNKLARDSYSLLHFPMVLGIILVAFGLKKILSDVDDELKIEVAFGLLGGLAIYLLGLVAFRFRHVRTLNRQRVAVALLCLALLPAATALPSLATLAIVNVLLWAMVAYETRGYGEGRKRIRHDPDAEPPPLAAQGGP
jgi:low temperature requirement protein LtrA